MKPVILAAGRGTRYEGKTDKSLMVVDRKPVIYDALYTLTNMGFSSEDIRVVVGAHNKDAIKSAIGDPQVKMIEQQDLTGPATAVSAVYDSDPTLDELLVIQADDAAWFDRIMQDFARFHDRRHALASMALLASGDPRVHYNRYQVDRSGMIVGHQAGLPERKTPGSGCNAGIYVVSREIFLASYEALSPPQDLGLPKVIGTIVDAGLPVGGPIYDIPWKSANTEPERQVAHGIIEVNPLVTPSISING